MSYFVVKERVKSGHTESNYLQRKTWHVLTGPRGIFRIPREVKNSSLRSTSMSFAKIIIKIKHNLKHHRCTGN